MNNYPYNPYGYNPQQYQEEYRKLQLVNRQKREFRKRCTLVALGMVLYVVLNYAVAFLIIKPNDYLLNLYFNNTGFSYCIDVVIVAVSMFGAYLIPRLIIDKKREAFIPLALPENKKHAFLLIPFGLLSCIAGSYATYYLDNVLENVFNVTFSQPEINEPKTPVEFGLFLLGTAVVPCIFEEIALRAGALEALRKYGDWFAVIGSAFIFAVLHGNMVQIPFAFIVGLAIGYIYIVTGSIWPGVIIHFINNLTSCSVEFGNVFGLSEDTVNMGYGVYAAIAVVAGTVCFIVYLFDKKKPKLNRDSSSLTFSQKLAGFFINAPMIAGLLYMGYVTSMYIE